MGLLGRVFSIIGILILAVIGLGAYLYFTDYGVQATVTDKGADSTGHWIDVTTKVGGYKTRETLDASSWALINVDGQKNFVVFHVQTKHIEVYDHEGGKLLYQG